MADRNELRAAIFSSESKKRKSKIINLLGSEVEVRQPTIGQVNRLANRKDDVAAIVSVLIEYCYVPGTNEKVFDQSDRDGLLDLPTGSWLQEFNGAIEEFAGIKVKDAEKNSEETA